MQIQDTDIDAGNMFLYKLWFSDGLVVSIHQCVISFSRLSITPDHVSWITGQEEAIRTTGPEVVKGQPSK